MHVTDEQKAPLLQLMYKHAFVAPAAIAFGTAGPPTITLEQAQEILNKSLAQEFSPGYFDYLLGHGMKVDFSGNEIDFSGYDRDAPNTTAEELLAQLTE